MNRRPRSEAPRLRWRYALKMLARSRSLAFTRHAASPARGAEPACLRWNGRDVFYRPGTSDPFVLYQVLLKGGAKAEYYVPPAVEPETIVDIGSNIGASILYFHSLFPRARIIGFEPHPESFAILQRNIAGLENIEIFAVGLGEKDETLRAFSSSDFSRFALRIDETIEGESQPADCQIRHAGRFFAELDLKQIDLLKLDCEGSEAAIFRALPDEFVRACRWIVGEMHDASGFEILQRLAPDFDLDLKKRMFSPSFRFHACQSRLAPALRPTFDRRALQT